TQPICRVTSSPTVTIGLTWPPESLPSISTSTSTVIAATIALPVVLSTANVSANVPTSSAISAPSANSPPNARVVLVAAGSALAFAIGDLLRIVSYSRQYSMCMLGNKLAVVCYTTCMALYVKQDESRAQLSSKVAADLAQRLNKRALDHN